MRQLFLFLGYITVIFSSCEVNVKDGKETKDVVSTKIRNGIVIKSKGITVEQAFLFFEDKSFVPEDNAVKVNQKVFLRLVVSGWKEKEGKVFISGGEIVETSKGEIVLDSRDLFKDYKDGFTPDDARYINLNVVITEVNELYDYYKVSFFIKDDSNPGSFAEGYYKLYLK